MPISVTCPACRHKLAVKDEYAGRKGKCPKCQGMIAIPGPEASGGKPPQPAAPAAKTREQLHEEILAAFHGKIEVPKVSFGRKLGTVFVLSGLILLPLLYWAMLAALAAVPVWLWHSELGRSLPPLARWLAIGGSVFILLCLLKPLFEPRRRRVRGYALDLSQERLLTDVVGKVCELLDAPPPQAIVLECSTSLAAEYRGGVFGLLKRNVVLTIGLPLLASLTVEQFAGLVAGQMAQFRRRAGCRATNLIREIEGWLWRSIFQQDRFDQWISRLIRRRPGFHAGTLLWPVFGIKLIAQSVLWVPMFIANTLASGVVRRTELDGDRCHARLAGGKSFAEVLPRVRIIDYTCEGILSELAFRYKDQSLPDSLPQQVQLQMVDMTPDLCAILLETAVKPAVKPFDSRPNDADRLAAAAAESPDGVVDCPLPAHELLSNYAAQARSMTWDYYVAMFGPQLLRTALKKVGS